jgi:hypothetical protein
MAQSALKDGFMRIPGRFLGRFARVGEETGPQTQPYEVFF